MPHLIYVKRVFKFQKAFRVGLVPRYVFGGLESTLWILKYFQLSGIHLTYRIGLSKRLVMLPKHNSSASQMTLAMLEMAELPHTASFSPVSSSGSPSITTWTCLEEALKMLRMLKHLSYGERLRELGCSARRRILEDLTLAFQYINKLTRKLARYFLQGM